MNKRILFVEDDDEYRDLLLSILKNEGYIVDAASSPVKAMDLFEKDKYDLVISDFKMSHFDGIQLLNFIKKIDLRTRTMILTASPSAKSEMESLDLNVDKYVVKETRMDILLKHIEYLLLLTESISSSVNHILTSPTEEIVLDLDARKITKIGEEVQLTMKQYGLLKLFLERKGQAVSREEIINELWDTDHEDIDLRIVDGHVKELRKKLDIQSIVSIRGYGYKWND